MTHQEWSRVRAVQRWWQHIAQHLPRHTFGALLAACHHMTGLVIVAITGLAYALQAVVPILLFFLSLLSVAMVAIPSS